MGYYDFDDHFWSPCEVCGQFKKRAKKAGETWESQGLFQQIWSKVFSGKVLGVSEKKKSVSS